MSSIATRSTRTRCAERGWVRAPPVPHELAPRARECAMRCVRHALRGLLLFAASSLSSADVCALLLSQDGPATWPRAAWRPSTTRRPSQPSCTAKTSTAPRVSPRACQRCRRHRPRANGLRWPRPRLARPGRRHRRRVRWVGSAREARRPTAPGAWRREARQLRRARGARAMSSLMRTKPRARTAAQARQTAATRCRRCTRS